jgi:hypothetical protein
MKGASVLSIAGLYMPVGYRWIGALFCFYSKAKGRFLHNITSMKQNKPIYDAAICIALLRAKQEQLTALGQTRYPRRSDFSEAEVVAIKAFLGPGPRALEAAGLKPPRDADGTRAELLRQKRIRQKRARRQDNQPKD